MFEIEFIFCKTNKVFGRLINWRTYGDWSHVAVRIIDTDNNDFPCIVEASFMGGVRLTTINRLKHSYEQVVYKRIGVDKHASDLFVCGLSQVGKPYDYKAIAGAFFRREAWVNSGAWYCSELAAWIAYKMCLKLFDRGEKIITPQMLYTALSPQVVRVEGVYK